MGKGVQGRWVKDAGEGDEGCTVTTAAYTIKHTEILNTSVVALILYLTQFFIYSRMNFSKLANALLGDLR